MQRARFAEVINPILLGFHTIPLWSNGYNYSNYARTLLMHMHPNSNTGIRCAGLAGLVTVFSNETPELAIPLALGS